MAISRFLIGGVASALLLTGGLFMWAGYTQIAEEEVLPEPPPALVAIPVAGANGRSADLPCRRCPRAEDASREERRFESLRPRPRHALIGRGRAAVDPPSARRSASSTRARSGDNPADARGMGYVGSLADHRASTGARRWSVPATHAPNAVNPSAIVRRRRRRLALIHSASAEPARAV